MARSSVVLPEPDGPSSATSSPRRNRQIDVAQRRIIAEILLDALDADLDALQMRRVVSDGVDRRFDRRSAIRETS